SGQLQPVQPAVSGFPDALRWALHTRLVQGQAELHDQRRAALGSQHAVVRHARQNRDHRPWAAIDSISTAPTGWVVPGDPGIPSTLAPTRYNNFGPRIGIAYSPNFSDGFLGKLTGGPGKTSIRAAFGIFYTSIEDLNLFY